MNRNAIFILVIILTACCAVVLLNWQSPALKDTTESRNAVESSTALSPMTSGNSGYSIQDRKSSSPAVAVPGKPVMRNGSSSSVPSQFSTRPKVLRAAQGGTLGLQMSPLPRGKAKLRVGLRDVAPQNHSGHYQRVLVEGDSETSVNLQWAGAGAERPVFVHAIHGGQIDGESSRTLYTDKSGRLAFNFSTNSEAGRYEVLLRSGPTEEVLHFWVPTGAPEIDRYGL